MLFKTIPNKDSKLKTYQISRDGTALRSVDKRNGKITKMSMWDHNGYRVSKIGKVHQLVAETFVPKPEDYDETFTVDHEDNDPMNNHADNLFWKSKSDQIKNQRKKSRTQIDSMPIIAMKDGKVVHTFESMSQVSMIGASQSCVSACINGKQKAHMDMTWTTPPSDSDLPDEEWKEVSSSRQYKVLLSNLGRVAYAFKCGYIKKVSSSNKITERMTRERDGYPRMDINGKSCDLHVLMWLTFVGPIPAGLHVNHIDHNKQNAALNNLELVTPAENLKKAHDAGIFDDTKSRRKCVVIDGMKYESISEAVRKTNKPETTIRRRLNNGTYTNILD